MTLVIDIGNTNIVSGIYKEDKLTWFARFKTDKFRTSEEYYALLSAIKQNEWDTQSIKAVVLASVVPDMTRLWQHLIRKYFSLEPILINAYALLGITFLVEDPGFIGADLIANAFAAWKKYNSSCIVIDLGTATTIQLISKEGCFMGASIAPGVKTASLQLFEKAALLSEIELTAPPHILGTNTTDALLSGIVKGNALMVESFILQIKQYYQTLQPYTVILTGGVADLLAPLIPSVDIVDKTLTIDGLFLASKHLQQIIQ